MSGSKGNWSSGSGVSGGPGLAAELPSLLIAPSFVPGEGGCIMALMVAVSTVSGGIGGSTIRTSTHIAPSGLNSVRCTARVKDSAIFCKGGVIYTNYSPP